MPDINQDRANTDAIYAAHRNAFVDALRRAAMQVIADIPPYQIPPSLLSTALQTHVEELRAVVNAYDALCSVPPEGTRKPEGTRSR
jgi:hypothetical protein